MRFSNQENERLAQSSLRRSRERRSLPLQRKSNLTRFCVVSALLIAAAVIGTLALLGTWSGLAAAALIVAAVVAGSGARTS